MALEFIMASLAVFALVSRLIEILDLKFKFLSERAEKINDSIFWFFIVMIFCFWLFSIATVEVAQ